MTNASKHQMVRAQIRLLTAHSADRVLKPLLFFPVDAASALLQASDALAITNTAFFSLSRGESHQFSGA